MIAVLFAGPASAQTAGFGTQVKFGESDFIPTIDAVVALAASGGTGGTVLYVDFGLSGDPRDDTVYLNTGTIGTASVTKDDIRLTKGPASQAAGSVVTQNDQTETNAAVGSAATAVGFRYADVNQNSRYDENDYVYLTAGADANEIRATTGSTQWTIRLTTTPGGAPGTFVFAAEKDLVDYPGTAGTGSITANFALFNKDRSDPGVSTVEAFTDGDRLYIARGSPSAGQTSTIPLYSIRLAGDTGQFGTQVKYGESDFIVKKDGVSQGTTSTVAVIGVDFGGGGTVDQFAFYADQTATTGSQTVAKNDIRLTKGPAAQAPGTLVLTTETQESGAAGTATAASCWFADLDTNGVYNPGDYVYLSSATSGTMVATTSLTAFTIRLTMADTFQPGTLVKTTDADFTTWKSSATDPTETGGFADCGWVLFNRDLSTGGTATDLGAFTPGDRIYFEGSTAGITTTTNGGLIALGSVRIYADTGQFGSVAGLGASDFIPTMKLPAGSDFEMIRYDGGTTDSITDDTFVVDVDSGACSSTTCIEKDDIVLATEGFGGKKVGDLIKTDDVTLIGKGAEVTGEQFVYADVNHNGRYDGGDWVYLSNSASAIVATTNTAGTYSLRLTDTENGKYKAGSMVKSGDSDLIAWGSSVAQVVAAGGANVFSYFDADLRPRSRRPRAARRPRRVRRRPRRVRRRPRRVRRRPRRVRRRPRRVRRARPAPVSRRRPASALWPSSRRSASSL
ncbi:MAG: hypothetical protein HYT80_02845 [Euryarchaeota archaeon]|nr:hypothetical protein [Euryarchaeota archaeon]